MLVEGASPTLLRHHRRRVRARPAVHRPRGSRRARTWRSSARAWRGRSSAAQSPLGQTLTLAGDTYTVVGELAKRRGGFFGENRQDSVLNLPAGTVRDALRRAGARGALRAREAGPARGVLPRDRGHPAPAAQAAAGRADNDFNLSTADQIIATFDGLSARIGLVTVGLAAVSLLIGAIGIANVMFISVTERTREIGLRLAVGARRQEVLLQFLLEAAFLSAIGGLAGVAAALGIGLLLTLVVSGFSAVAPLWAIVAGLVARRRRHRRRLLAGAAGRGLDPVEALRHE